MCSIAPGKSVRKVQWSAVSHFLEDLPGVIEHIRSINAVGSLLKKVLGLTRFVVRIILAISFKRL